MKKSVMQVFWNLFRLFITLIMFSNANAVDVVRYPDMSNSKEVIKQRSEELKSELKEALKKLTGNKLAEKYGKLAQFYHAHDFTDVAISLYKKAIDNSPKNSKWYYLLAMAYKSNGDFEKAEENFIESWKYNDGYLSTKVYLAEIYLQQGELLKAKTAFKEVLNKQSDFPRALVGFGQVLFQEGDAKGAIENYKKAIALQPAANQINFLLSQAYASLGEVEEAGRFNKIKGKLQAQMYDPLIMHMLNESRSASYYNVKAVRAYMAKDFVNSEKLALKAIKYDKESPYPYVTLANIYVATKRAKQATQVLEKVIVKNEKDPNLKYSIGVIEEILGNNDKAIYWYNKVLSQDVNYRKARITLASALMRKGSYKKALVELKKAEKLDPNNAYVVQKKAAIYAYLQDCAEAEKEIYRSVALLPKDFSILLTFVKISVECDVSDGMQEDALNAARNMYNISQDPVIVEVLALIEAKNNNFDLAIDYQAQAIFQELLKNQGEGIENSENLKRLKVNLKLFEDHKYPDKVFRRDDEDLYPQSFERIK